MPTQIRHPHLWLRKSKRLFQQAPSLETPHTGSEPVLVSARTGSGLSSLIARIEQQLPFDRLQEVRLRVPHSAGKIMHLLHEHGQILVEHYTGSRVDLVARVPGSLVPQIQEFRTRNKR